MDTTTAARDAPQGAPRRFSTTRWSLIYQATAPDGYRALAALCRRYWAPVHAFIQGHGLTADDAADVTQGLFETLLRRNDLATVDQARGQFRSWLRACARHYLLNWFAHRGGVAAGGKVRHVDIDLYHDALQDHGTPDRLFDRRWALTVMERALGRLRDRYERAGKGSVFAHLQPGLAGARHQVCDRELSRLLERSVGAIKVERHRLKQRFQECLRAEIRQTVLDASEVEDELRRLIDALA